MAVSAVAWSAYFALACGLTAADPRQTLTVTPCYTYHPAYAVLHPHQAWDFDAANGGSIVLRASKNSSAPLCLAALDAAQRRSTEVGATPCVNGSSAQQWRAISDPSGKGGALVSADGKTTLSLRNGGIGVNTQVWNGAMSKATLTYEPVAGTLTAHVRGSFNRQVAKSLCLAWGAPAVRPCAAASPAALLPMCNASLGVDARVADLVGRLAAAEIAPLLRNEAAAVDRLWIQQHNFWNEALHGVQAGCAEATGPAEQQQQQHCPTSFPAAISTASSFNKTLFRQVGAVIGREARALANVGVTDGFTFWSPNLNIFRDPRWGRGQETPGEDPTLNGEYGAAFIGGFQGTGAAGNGTAVPGGSALPRWLLASSCAKHFFGYNLENCYVAGDNCRLNFDARTSQGDIEEAAVERAQVTGLMCSYNAVNGVPSCVNSWSMSTVARGQWNFSGYITSDCGAVANVLPSPPTAHPWSKSAHGGHGYATPNGTAAATLAAGMDSNCALMGGPPLPGSAVASDITRALTKLFSVLVRLGVFEAAASDAGAAGAALAEADVGTAESAAAAVEAARQGLVLLKNDAGTLPLAPVGEGNPASQQAQALSVAVIGPCTAAYNGGYSQVHVPEVAMDAALRPFVGNVSAAPGCAPGAGAKSAAACGDDSGFGKAVALAAAPGTDAVVLALGLDSSMEGENGDFRAMAPASGVAAEQLSLPGKQLALLDAVAGAVARARPGGRKVTVVVTGSSVDLAPLKADPRVGAILWAGYSGQGAGQAIAETVLGHSNPSGRLTSTFYPADFASNWAAGFAAGGWENALNASYFDAHMRPNATTGNPGRGYRYYRGRTNASYEFGDGFGYSSFGYAHEDNSSRGGPIKRMDLSLGALRSYAATTPPTTSQGTLLGAPRAPGVSLALRVTNMGEVAGAEPVLLFVTPPPGVAGVGGAPLRALGAFEKVGPLRPGASATVRFSLGLRHFVLSRPGGGLEARGGRWSLSIGKHVVAHVDIA